MYLVLLITMHENVIFTVSPGFKRPIQILLTPLQELLTTFPFTIKLPRIKHKEQSTGKQITQSLISLEQLFCTVKV